MNSSIRHALVAVTTLGAAVAIAGCSGSSPAGGHDNMPGMPGRSSSGSGGPQAANPHNAADVTFATNMIPHHQQAVEMAEMALSQANSAQLKTMAGQIKAAQDPEIRTMAGWLQSWGQPVPTGMAGMPGHTSATAGMAGMSGMMTEQEMQQLHAAAGADFDRLWLRMMTKHHEGAVTMATTQLQQGQNAAAKALAQQIITAQTEEIASMAQLLSTISS